MHTHYFTLVLDRLPDDDGYDRIFEAGCDDTSPEEHPDGTFLLHFMRKDATFLHAVTSAVHDVEAAGFTATRLYIDDTVWPTMLTGRLGMPEHAIARLISGEKGPGGFPPPHPSVEGGAEETKFYSWQEVAAWFSGPYGEADHIESFDRQVKAADHLIQARALLAGDPERDAFTGYMQPA